MTSKACLSIAAAVALLAATPGAQQRGLKTGNPTPGTPQPDPPNLASRITLTGCVQRASTAAAGSGAAHDPGAPSDSRFVLTKVERKNVVPDGTPAPAAAPASRSYRLYAIDSQLSPFVEALVEISGETEASGATSSGRTRTSPPTLHVEFVRRLASACQ
jgi:hypothetical protein